MFNKPLIKLLMRENARLRRDLARQTQRFDEVCDKFIHNRVPQRLTADRPTIYNSPTVTSSYPSDAYSQAIEDAEKRAMAPKPPYIDEDESND